MKNQGIQQGRQDQRRCNGPASHLHILCLYVRERVCLSLKRGFDGRLQVHDSPGGGMFQAPAEGGFPDPQRKLSLVYRKEGKNMDMVEYGK